MRRLSAANSPFIGVDFVESVGFTIGAESVNAISVAMVLKDVDQQAITGRGAVQAYLSGDANGDTIVAVAPSGGVVAGANGVVMPLGNPTNGVITHGTLLVDATAEKFKTTTTIVGAVGGAVFTKTAQTAILFSSAYTVNLAASGQKWGAFLVQVNPAGTISTRAVSADQAYASEAAAIAALPAAAAGNVAIGYITIQTKNATAWTANTDDMTAASDLAAVTFYNATVQNANAKQFQLISESDGTISLVITEAGVYTCYVAVALPDGRIQVSGAITFA